MSKRRMKNLIAFCYKCERYIARPFRFPSKKAWNEGDRLEPRLRRTWQRSQDAIKKHDLRRHPRSEDFPHFVLVELPVPPPPRRKVR